VMRILVVGGGQMGAGIAQVAAQNGIEALIYDTFPGALDRAKANIEKSLQKLSDKALIQEKVSDISARLRYSAQIADVKSQAADIVIEAIVENLEAKEKIFRELDALLPAKTIFCSNTSSISITKLAAATKRPDRFMGMHFMNPVPIMKLVELIEGLETSPATSKTVRETAEKMQKTCIVSKDRAGFVINRILMPMINESFYVLGEGIATAEDIDTGMKLGTHQPMGPLALADFIGLDTCLAIMEVLHKFLGDTKYRPAPLLRQYVEASRLGKKSGRGVYSY
jgi:3-hydroxybutyryl-CoA dehydrogenase